MYARMKTTCPQFEKGLRYIWDYKKKVCKAMTLLMLMSVQASAQELTYTQIQTPMTREEAWEQRVIKAQIAKHVSGGVLTIDGSEPAVQITADQDYTDAVHAILNNKR